MYQGNLNATVFQCGCLKLVGKPVAPCFFEPKHQGIGQQTTKNLGGIFRLFVMRAYLFHAGQFCGAHVHGKAFNFVKHTARSGAGRFDDGCEHKGCDEHEQKQQPLQIIKIQLKHNRGYARQGKGHKPQNFQ